MSGRFHFPYDRESTRHWPRKLKLLTGFTLHTHDKKRRTEVRFTSFIAISIMKVVKQMELNAMKHRIKYFLFLFTSRIEKLFAISNGESCKKIYFFLLFIGNERVWNIEFQYKASSLTLPEWREKKKKQERETPKECKQITNI